MIRASIPCMPNDTAFDSMATPPPVRFRYLLVDERTGKKKTAMYGASKKILIMDRWRLGMYTAVGPSPFCPVPAGEAVPTNSVPGGGNWHETAINSKKRKRGAGKEKKKKEEKRKKKERGEEGVVEEDGDDATPEDGDETAP